MFDFVSFFFLRASFKLWPFWSVFCAPTQIRWLIFFQMTMELKISSWLQKKNEAKKFQTHLIRSRALKMRFFPIKCFLSVYFCFNLQHFVNDRWINFLMQPQKRPFFLSKSFSNFLAINVHFLFANFPMLSQIPLWCKNCKSKPLFPYSAQNALYKIKSAQNTTIWWKIPENLQDFQENPGKFMHFTTSQPQYFDEK